MYMLEVRACRPMGPGPGPRPRLGAHGPEPVDQWARALVPRPLPKGGDKDRVSGKIREDKWRIREDKGG